MFFFPFFPFLCVITIEAKINVASCMFGSTVSTIQKLVDKLGTSEDKSQLQSRL